MSAGKPVQSMARPVGAIAGLFRFVLQRLPMLRILLLSALVLLSSLTEGFAVALLLPLLQIIEAGGDKAEGAVYLQTILGMFSGRPGLGVVLLLFLAMAIARAVLMRISQLMVVRTHLTLLRNVRLELYSAIAQASWTHLRRRNNAEFQTALTSQSGRLGQAIHFVLAMPARLMMLCIYILIALVLAPAMTGMAMLCGMLLLWLTRHYLTQSMEVGERLSESFQKLHLQMGEFLAGLKVAKMFGVQDRHIATFSDVLENVDRNMVDYERGAANAHLVQNVLSAMLVAVFLWAGYTVWELPIAELLVLALVFHRILPLLQFLHQAAQELLYNADAVVSIARQIEECTSAREIERSDDAHDFSAPAHIIAREIAFRYSDAGPLVLEGIDLELKPGSLTVITGESGAGKSTLLDILCGLIEPASGTLVINGDLLQADHLMAWRKRVGYSAQDSHLFDATIRANLAIADNGAGESELRRALTAAGAIDFVEALPLALDAQTGPHGGAFSGGERQRLAIARALVRRPALLVMDEPASALDQKNADFLMAGIARLRGETTIVLATHHPERLLTTADQILSMQNGCLQSWRAEENRLAQRG